MTTVSASYGQVPHLLSYQGNVSVSGQGSPFTGTGEFRFALIGPNNRTLWSNDRTSENGSEPEEAVELAVQDGFFSVLLGDTSLDHMAPLPPEVFLQTSDVSLRVWFDDGNNGSQQLTPDQRLSSVAYAMVAGEVADGAVDTAQLANGSVNASKLAPNSVGTVHLQNNAVTTSKLADGAVTSSKLANNSVGSAQLQSAITLGQGGVTVDYNGTKLSELRGYGLTSGGFLGLYDKLGDRSVLMTTRSISVKTPGGLHNAARLYNGTGGVLDLGDSAGTTRVRVRGSGTGQSGDITLYDKFGNDTVKLRANNGSSFFSGPEITLRSGDLDPALRLSGSLGGAVQLYELDGTPSISLTGIGGRITTKVLEITGGSDLSESFEINADDLKVQPGMLVCVDPVRTGELVPSRRAYDSTVAGVVSGAGGVNTGMVMGQAGSIADGNYPVALTGRVYCLADASEHSIKPGDLITTSDLPGHGMKVTDRERAQGTIIGKAMSGLDDGQGLVLVLVSLQ